MLADILPPLVESGDRLIAILRLIEMAEVLYELPASSQERILGQ